MTHEERREQAMQYARSFLYQLILINADSKKVEPEMIIEPNYIKAVFNGKTIFEWKENET